MVKKDVVKISEKPKIYLINLPQKSDEVFFDIYSCSGKLFENKKSVAHLLEHYLLGVFRKENRDTSLRANGFVGKEVMNLNFVCRSGEFLENLPLFLRSIFQPDLSQKKTFDYEKKAAINEFLKDSNDIASELAGRVKDFGVLKRCPYIQKEVCDAKEIAAVQLSDLKRFYNGHFLNSQPIFFIGAHQLTSKTVAQTKRIVGNCLSGLKLRKAPQKQCFYCPKISNFQSKEIKLKNINKGTYLFFVFPGLSIKGNTVKERLALNIFCRVFLDASNAVIFKRLREEGLYSLDYDNVFYDYVGFSNLACFSKGNNIPKVIKILKEEIDAVKSRPDLIDEKMFKITCQRIINDQKTSWFDNEEKYRWIKNDLIHDGAVIGKDFYRKTLKSINQKFLSQIARKVFDWNKHYLFLARRFGKSGLKKAIKI